MSTSPEMYVELVKAGDLPQALACPCCGSPPTLWQYTEIGGTTSKVVMCDNGDPIIDSDFPAEMTGCLLFMPPPSFYKATRREAIAYWNAYAENLTRLRDIRDGLDVTEIKH